MIYSPQILMLVAVMLLLYYVVPSGHRWKVLLAGSLIYYGLCGGIYLLYLLGITAFTYFCAIRLDKLKQVKGDGKKAAKKARKTVVCVVVLAAAGVLALFKTAPLAERFSLILPIGISYYSFMVIGYVIDVYRGDVQAEKNFLHYALFAGYFPAMVQGPINRFGDMKEQFFGERHFSLKEFRGGFELILWGLFKKLVIADRCAVYIGEVMKDALPEMSGSELLVGMILFVLQMYGDFSGGIDMAEGVSELFGIRMYRNFRQPFMSLTIGEFWRRWHMSLSNWIRDYCFYPMAFSKTYRKLSKAISEKDRHLGESLPGMLVSVITFVIIGLWHEISLTYLLYGLWYGVMVGLGQVMKPYFGRAAQLAGVRTECLSYRMFQRFRTFLIVLVGESLCVVNGVGAFFTMITIIFTRFRPQDLFFGIFNHGLTQKDFLLLLAGVLVWCAVSSIQNTGVSVREKLAEQNLWFRWALTFGIILVIAVYGMYGPGFDAAGFIYRGI